MAKPKNRKELVQLFVNRINKGIQFLDKELGRGKWVKNIKLEELELDSPDMCICGQAFASTINKLAKDDHDEYSDGFNYAVEKFFKGDAESSAKYGFYVEDEICDEFEHAYDLLTSLWIAKLGKMMK